MRRVEHLHRGGRSPRERPGAGGGGREPARGQAAARGRHPRKRTPPHRSGQRRGEPRTGRRTGPRLARAAGRRAGHRQIDPLAANRARGQRPAHPLCLGRGVGRTDPHAGSPHRHRQRGVHGLSRDPFGAHRGADRGAATRSGGHRLDPDRLHRSARIVGRQRLADPRVRRHAAQIRQRHRHPDLHHRPHHQGRHHSRSEGAGAHRRCGAAIRGRQQLHLPHSARHQEPFRRHVRNRRLRDARRRPARSGQPLGDPAHPLRRTAERPTACGPI